MIDMKRTKSESDESKEVAMGEEDYPYGLSISLDQDSLEKLGIAELPKVGAEMMLMAKVKVTSTNESQHENQSHKSVSLQITEMELEQGQAERPAASSVMYGSDE